MKNIKNCNSADSVACRQKLLGESTTKVIITDSGNVGLGEFRFVVSAPANWIFPALLNHVMRIVFVRSKEKMIRVAAPFIVAAVKHAKTGWDFSFGQFPSHPMGKAIWFCTKAAVTACKMASVPVPTAIFFDDSFPESFLHWLCASGHGLSVGTSC